MEPRIEEIPKKYLVGMRIETSLAKDETAELWKAFMPRRNEIPNKFSPGYYSVQIFPESLDFKDFNENVLFEKWAAIEVSDLNAVPEGMESHTLGGGKYAVFIHKGAAHTFPKTYQYIYGVWLPKSDFELDKREHFEFMGADYRPDDDNAEEEVWVPIK